ncbi:MAG: nitroreductase family protein, partial [Proteobacteria bacterium]|nr:nitroreductase family protein [Pseudomonadota bacterium]
LRVPDHGRCFPWRIQVIKKEGQQALGEIAANEFAKDHPGATPEEIEFERARLQRAPILLVVTRYLNHEKAAKVPLIEQELSGGALCQNILNGSHAIGYVAQWLTEWPAYSPAIRKALGHTAETEIIGLMYIGSATEPPSERSRAEIADVVTEWSGPTA